MSGLTSSWLLASSPVISLLAAAVICLLWWSFHAFILRTACPAKAGADNFDLPGVSILAAWSFFTKRHDFMFTNFKRTGRQLFRFRVLRNYVVAISGEAGRKAFYNDKDLDLAEGYKVLHGTSPDLEDIKLGEPWELEFPRFVLDLCRTEKIVDLFPSVIRDTDRLMADWGESGVIDPFKDIYNIVFQMLVRFGSCRELADDEEAVTRLCRLFGDLEKCNTPSALLFPWFPSPARKAREKITAELFVFLSNYVDVRRKASVVSSDAIDTLLTSGWDTEKIVSIVLSIIFAGVNPTGIGSAWMLVYLAINPEWKVKVAQEVSDLITKHTDTTSSEPLYKRLETIPISAWEGEMPVLDAIIRETLRLNMTGTMLRRNVVQDITVANYTIRKGDFMAYSLADTHLDSQIFPDPHKFDPLRYVEGREEDKKTPLAHLAWGAGRHPCAGTRFAKLGMKLVVAYFLASFDYEIVDSSGRFPSSLPIPDRNDILPPRPFKPCYLKFKKIVK